MIYSYIFEMIYKICEAFYKNLGFVYFQDEPYLMMRKTKIGETLNGNDRYEGYCKDLADLISRKLNINCE